jgi:hypothetical protein
MEVVGCGIKKLNKVMRGEFGDNVKSVLTWNVKLVVSHRS